MDFEDTIVAPATPAGESAIALIRLTGSECLDLVTKVFGLQKPNPRIVRHGHYRDLEGESVDEVLFTYFAEDASYTGEASLEISSHGNPFIVQKIVEDLLKRGCRMAEPGEFTKRAFLNGKLDLSQAEAVIDVIHARSDRALIASQKQLAGVVGKCINGFTDRLLSIIAQVEAYIDFPDEDLPSEDEIGPAHELAKLCDEFSRLISTQQYTRILHDGLKIVIIGEANAGKSSLLNIFCGGERVIVSDIPGTTRDFIEERVMLGSYLVRLIDTAGLHDDASGLECLGIAKTMEQMESADLLLVVVDGTRDKPAFPTELLEQLSCERSLLVQNKVDLIGFNSDSSFLPDLKRFSISALTGEGLPELQSAILEMVERTIPDDSSDSVLVSARHADALQRAKNSLGSAREKLLSGIGSELVACDLRDSLSFLGEILGKIDNERMLDKLFDQFCIGK